ncbi:AbrB/MazE/SpoVT family DNA-binding domain-containing protein [Geminicoccus roseus]|uniref:AbrB/MazE/SpoVT family DNA-binding domain-containing protein n=1 Tax=Geminicoccus roseus TaxID=404900 RepID=UPI0003F4F6C5|nr:AbrB/MazE/SpoVT family DNA-binding domain-containing protein [Geminicoccus roseus]
MRPPSTGAADEGNGRSRSDNGSLQAELRKRHGLAQGGEVLVEDIGDAIVLRTLDQVVARA